MAGAKGKSGGARNGAGRPKKKPVLIDVPNSNSDPKAFLIAVMDDQAVDVRIRVDAARTLMPYLYPKKGEGGKKEQQAEAAKKVSHGLFSLRQPPPRMIINNDR